MSSLPKPPARFLVPAPTLKQLASQQIALHICRHTVHNKVDVCNDQYEWRNFINDVIDPDILAGIPVVEIMVTESLWNPVAYSVQRWFNYHMEKVFFDRNNVDLNEVLVKCIDAFVLKSDGTVNFLKTAQNLLLGDVLRQVEKFRLACITCMADDIRNIWPFVSDDPLVVNHDAQQHPMIHYWTCVLQGDFRRLPGDDAADSLETCANVLKNMEWTAVEYFWNFLSNDERVTLATKLLKSDGATHPATLDQLLFKLTSEQLQSIIMEEEEEDITYGILMSYFTHYHHCGVSFLQVWRYFSCIVRQSAFPSIMKKFVKYTFRGSGYTSDNCELVNKMWINTPAHLKRTLLISECCLDYVFDALNTEHMTHLPKHYYDMSFFINLFTELSFQTRNRIWRKFWFDLIVCAHPNYFQRIMELCFNNNDEITLFKERDMLHIPNIHHYCCLLIASSRVKALNEYFNFCSTNANYTSSVKRQLLYSIDILHEFFINMWYSDFIEFDKFIDSAFFDEKEAREYKRSIMLSSQLVQDIYAEIDKSKIGVSWI